MSDTRIINRRQSDPDDSDRQRRRAQVREMAARRDMELQPALLAEADIEQSKRRADEAADKHQRQTAPLQLELQDLEQRAIQRIGRREAPDAAEDERRAELLAELREANHDLERTLEKERNCQADFARKARRLREGRPPGYTILMDLAKPPLASPRLLAAQHVCRERIKWLEARKSAAQRALRICQHNAEEIRADRMSGDLSVWTWKVAAWEAELAAVGQELGEAVAAQEQNSRELLDE